MARILNAALATSVAGLIIAAGPPPVSNDAVQGQKVFQQNCALCHSVVAGRRANGPSLFGIVGRKSGSVEGYSYSSAMKASGLSWTSAQLRTYIAAPRKIVPGTKMAFAGMTDPHKVEPLLAYLNSLK